MRLLLVYKPGCPNCNGPIDEERLEKGLPCSACLPDPPSVEGLGFEERVLLVGRALEEAGKLRGYWYLYRTVSLLREFERFFEAATGSRLWSAQRTWAQRMLAGESLALVAPTGVGKTTLLTVYSIYTAEEGRKVYYIVPTGNLAVQVLERLKTYSERVRAGLRIVGYSTLMPSRVRAEALEAIERGDYDILVTTVGFLPRRWSLLEGRVFDVVVVDDVDAVLRNSRNVERLLQLIGVSPRALELGLEIVKTKMRASVAKASGKVHRYEELLRKIDELEAELSRELMSKLLGQLVIASATGRAKGYKPKLFRELLGFDVGRVYDTIRNVSNTYVIASDPLSKAASLVKELVKDYHVTGLVFVSQLLGRVAAKLLVKELERAGVRAGLALSGVRSLDAFARGDLDVLVGVASYYGVIVRGLDMPERVYFTLFVEPPAQRISLSSALNSPLRLTRVALALGIEGSRELVKAMSRLGPGELMALRIALEKGEPLEGRLGELAKKLRALKAVVLSVLRDMVRKSGGRFVLRDALALVEDRSGVLSYVVPDAATYVQASGRASRLYRGGMTRGISIVVTSVLELLELLSLRLRRFIEASSFTELTRDVLKHEVEEAKRSRFGGGGGLDVESALIVVESPTKAKTIARFFGKPVRRRIGSIVAYETTFYNPVDGKVYVTVIAASRGHVYDLTVDDEGVYGVAVEGSTFRPIYVPIKQCLSCGMQFASGSNVCPRCGSTNVVSKEAVIDALRKLASEVDTVYLATDPDIEGEKIAYDLYLLLKPVARSVKRIELHEITRRELFNALAKPRSVSKPTSYAQVVRRVEDRWIGFGLSRILWSVFGKRWLGAGRVQTPVLGWIVERYMEWKRERGYVVAIKLPFGYRLRLLFKDRVEAEEVARRVESEGVRIVRVSLERVRLTPLPPYTTESLIHDASLRLGYTSEKTMKLAQDLFETGLITYHRTDSTHVSTAGMEVAKRYLEDRGYSFRPRAWGQPGHHEAIRPTLPYDAEKLRELVATGELRLSTPLRESHYRLYDLIFRRFIASQAEEALVVKVDAVLDVGGVRVEADYYTSTPCSGFTCIYQPAGFYPNALLKPGETVKPLTVRVFRGSAVRLLTHGDAVVMMKRKGIGRPSTYARTLQQLKNHGYVVESKYRKYLIPTRLGVDVYSYLSTTYGQLVSEERTRAMEERLAMVERGEVDAADVVAQLLEELAQVLGDERMIETINAVKASEAIQSF